LLFGSVAKTDPPGETIHRQTRWTYQLGQGAADDA
jgi:hypothetical protein